jgi:hypothetical protein
VTRLAVVLLLLLLAFGGVDAYAQTDNRFAVGLDYIVRTSDRASTEDYARGQLGPGLLWRFGEAKQGWGFHWGLNWYAIKIERPIGGATTELGELHVRPLMAGYGYTRVVGRTSITADLLGGYAFGSMFLGDGAAEAYRTRLGARTVTAGASGSLVLKPEVIVWRDISRRLGATINVGYMIARPEVVINIGPTIDARTARADQFVLRVGAVYSLFSSDKKKQARAR